jgi:BNR repeat-like domain
MGRVVLALAVAVLLALPGPATAKTIIGTAKAERLVGTKTTDQIDSVGGGRDTLACKGGRDIVNADGADRVGADCEVVSRRVSMDTLKTPGQHQTQVEPSIAANGSTVVATFQVGRFLDGAAAGIGWATSSNGGRTWRSGLLPAVTGFQQPPGTVERASDPAVAYDAAHRTWLVVTLGVGVALSNIAISRSQDGVAWAPPVIATQALRGALAYDKEWIACDNSSTSAFYGTCYVVYSDFVGNRLAVQVSKDGGATWSTPITASRDSGGDVSGAIPVVQQNGAATILFLASDIGIYAVRSTDGGTTWSPRVGVSPLDADLPNGLRVPPLPAATVDAAGRIYLVWADCGFRSDCNGTDIVLSTSSDGLAWTQPRTIRGIGFDRFIPGIGADPTTPGKLGLLFFFRPTGNCSAENDTCRIGVAYTRSDDGGATWRAPQRLDARPMAYSWLADTTGGAFFGDYAGGVFSDGAFVPIFALAQPPTRGVKHEAMFSARLP